MPEHVLIMQAVIVILGIVCTFRFLRFCVDRLGPVRAAPRTNDAEILDRLDRIEKRTANLESIVLELDKKNQFERSL